MASLIVLTMSEAFDRARACVDRGGWNRTRAQLRGCLGREEMDWEVSVFVVGRRCLGPLVAGWGWGGLVGGVGFLVGLVGFVVVGGVDGGSVVCTALLYRAGMVGGGVGGTRWLTSCCKNDRVASLTVQVAATVGASSVAVRSSLVRSC